MSGIHGVGPTGLGGIEAGKVTGASGNFADTLKTAMSEVEKLDQNAQQQVTGLLNGDGQDVHSAMIAVEKADAAFQMMMQVRNKIVAAYQEISRMQF